VWVRFTSVIKTLDLLGHVSSGIKHLTARADDVAVTDGSKKAFTRAEAELVGRYMSEDKTEYMRAK
jgi:hypothetical protein